MARLKVSEGPKFVLTSPQLSLAQIYRRDSQASVSRVSNSRVGLMASVHPQQCYFCRDRIDVTASMWFSRRVTVVALLWAAAVGTLTTIQPLWDVIEIEPRNYYLVNLQYSLISYYHFLKKELFKRFISELENVQEYRENIVNFI